MIRHGLYRSASSMPEKIQKELDKRRIVGSYNNIVEAYKDKSHHRRHNSWDNGNGMTRMSPDQSISPIDINQSVQINRCNIIYIQYYIQINKFLNSFQNQLQCKLALKCILKLKQHILNEFQIHSKQV